MKGGGVPFFLLGWDAGIVRAYREEAESAQSGRTTREMQRRRAGGQATHPPTCVLQRGPGKATGTKQQLLQRLTENAEACSDISQKHV